VEVFDAQEVCFNSRVCQVQPANQDLGGISLIAVGKIDWLELSHANILQEDSRQLVVLARYLD